MDYWNVHALKGAQKWYMHTDNDWISFRYDGKLTLRRPENYREIPCRTGMIKNNGFFDPAAPLARFRCLDGHISTEVAPGNTAQGYSRIIEDTQAHQVLFTVPEWYNP